MSTHSGKRRDGITRCGYNHSMWLDAETLEFIEAYAAKNERSKSWTAQMLVKIGLATIRKLPVQEMP